MNLDKLMLAKKLFLDRYPGGFEDPQMDEIRKKHKPEKMHSMAREYFAQECFDNTDALLENMVKVVTRSSMVSVFEKPRFREFSKLAAGDEKTMLVMGLKNMLHGNHELGFNMMVDILQPHKLAKWTLVTICPYYYYPEKEVFIKPTTAKGAISFFELEGLEYKALPYYEFYTGYKRAIDKMKKLVKLTNDNAAVGGFIMSATNADR